jgi:hypothetical protein
MVDLLEPVVDLGELPPEEFDQLFVLGRRHGPMTIPSGGPMQPKLTPARADTAPPWQCNK